MITKKICSKNKKEIGRKKVRNNNNSVTPYFEEVLETAIVDESEGKDMKGTNIAANQKEFKVKRHWWIWAIFIVCNIVVIQICFRGLSDSTGEYVEGLRGLWFSLGFFGVFLAAYLILLPDVTHYSYVINDKFLVVKRVLYPCVEIPLHTITAIDKATLMSFRGFGLKIYEESFGSYKITYKTARKHVVILSPKDSLDFMLELGSHVERAVILIDNFESAFKKKKDDT